jgi:hypothetical protein
MIPSKLFGVASMTMIVAVMSTALPARAQDAVLYELTENMKLRAGDRRRAATAALSGRAAAGSPICPKEFADALGVDECVVTATASDNIDIATGIGDVNGKFTVVIQGDNPIDAAEFVVLDGSLSGTIDLSPTLQSIPLGSVTGTWSGSGVAGGPLDGLTVGGTFTGTFRLPFGTPMRALYLLDPTTGKTRPVEDNELALGVPTVRLEMTLQ